MRRASAFGRVGSLLTWRSVAIAALLGAPAFAQVHWDTNEGPCIQRAQAQQRLLIFHFTFDEKRGERHETNRIDKNRQAGREIFRDPGIAALTNQGFVACAADFKRNKELIARLGGRITANDIVIARPDLTLLERIDTGKGMTAANVRAALERSLLKWAEERYDADVKPILLDPQARPDAQKKALQAVRNFGFDRADADVIALLGQEKLTAPVRTLALQTLAALSTEDAVKELMRQAETYPPAEQALRKCKPRALPVLSTYLGGEPTPTFLCAYRTICTLAKTASKSDEFWQSADAAAREKEIARVKELAAKKGG